MALKKASRMPRQVRDPVLGDPAEPVGTSVAVSEMPSAASRYGILATDAADGVDAVAVAPVHRIGARRERLALRPAVRRVARSPSRTRRST